MGFISGRINNEFVDLVTLTENEGNDYFIPLKNGINLLGIFKLNYQHNTKLS